MTARSQIGKLKALRNAYSGRIGWILGNGPSVVAEDLEELGDQISFGANRIYLAYENLDFRPTYLVSCDDQMVRDFGQEMCDFHTGLVFLASDEAKKISSKNCVRLNWKGGTPLRFSPDASVNVRPGGGSLIVALQLGYFMGINRFFLYGVDHTFNFRPNPDAFSRLEQAEGDGNHFIPDYRGGKPWQPPVPWQAQSSFLMSHIFLNSRGGWIKNASHGGELVHLSRVNFEDALRLSRLNDAILNSGSSDR